MDEIIIIKRAAAVAMALAGLTDEEKREVMAIGRKVATLSSESVSTGKPVKPGKIQQPAGVFWAAAYATGCSRVPAEFGRKGRGQLFCGPGVKDGNGKAPLAVINRQVGEYL